MATKNNTLGEKIKKLRQELKLTQAELGGEEFTSSYISLIEKDKVNPSLKALNIIAKRLHKSVKYFLNDEENEDKELLAKNNQKIQTLISLGESLISKNELNQAEEYLQEALTLIKNDKNNLWSGIIYKNMGVIAFKQKKYDTSIQYFKNALDSFKKEKNYNQLAWVNNALGVVMAKIKRYRNSLEFYQSASNLIEEYNINDPDLQIKVLFNLGNEYSRLGELKKADRYLNKALSLINSYGNLTQVSKLYMSLGINFYELGNLDKALEYSRKSLEISEMIENMEIVAGLKTNLGMVYTQLGKYEEAEVLLQESMELKESMKIEDRKTSTLVEMARLYYHKKDYDQGLNYCQQAINLLAQYPDPLEEGKAYHLLGLIHQRQYQDNNNKEKNQQAKEHFVEAEKTFKQALNLFNSIDEKRYLAQVYSDMGDLYSEVDPVKANQYLKRSVKLYQNI